LEAAFLLPFVFLAQIILARFQVNTHASRQACCRACQHSGYLAGNLSGYDDSHHSCHPARLFSCLQAVMPALLFAANRG
jgi:hypothetical protein